MKKLLSTTIAVGIFASMSIAPAFAAVDAGALPSLGGSVNADVTTNGSNKSKVDKVVLEHCIGMILT